MTPMMEQYFEIKKDYKDFLLFYRLGDFYEMFFDDAVIGSRELELTLTGRDCGEEERAPMCGVPFHSADGYICKLIEKGYKVAICEQTEDPSAAKGLVRREVVRIITPGTVMLSGTLDEKKNNFLASVYMTEFEAGVGFADITTGQVYATSFCGEAMLEQLYGELSTYQPREVIYNLPASFLGGFEEFMKTRVGAILTRGEAAKFDFTLSEERVKEQFAGSVEDELFSNRVLISALGALISYVVETQKTDISYMSELVVYNDSQYLQMDTNTKRNLELCEAMRSKEKRGTLLWVLDKTKTAAGGRMLKSYIDHPLVSTSKIARRQRAVKELCEDFMLREELSELLSGVLDLERLIARTVYGSANGRDLIAIRNSIAILPELKAVISKCKSDELSSICRELDLLEDVHSKIDCAIASDAPFSVREGGIIADGYNADVDYLRSVMRDGKGWLERIAEREREETGIKTLKVSYNKVFGYYIEVSKSYVSQVPDRYIRKQTLTNGERYITEELKELESTILGASDKLASLEYEIFCEVRDFVAAAASRIQKTAALMATLDVYYSLAYVAVKNSYVCPEVDDSNVIEIKDGRHPVVEQFVREAYFVPNDTTLDIDKNRLMLITGPNMAGKSTYMRQIAAMVVMAQIGSFVPAREARIGVVDKLFTRVGASDDLASGQSTFMLEMTEVAYILKNATAKSLIIYDEVGRGTSTFDGMSIARAIIEYTHSKKIGAKTLFATHYHELTVLEDELPGVVNYNIAAKKRGDNITFLRKIIKGSTDDSYGIEVAKLAGVPNEVIKRAKEVLASVENKAKAISVSDVEQKPADDSIITFDDCVNEQIIEELRAVDINTLSPYEAMSFLFNLKKRLK